MFKPQTNEAVRRLRLSFVLLVICSALQHASGWNQFLTAPSSTAGAAPIVSTGTSAALATATLSGAATVVDGAFAFYGTSSASSNVLVVTVPETLFSPMNIGLTASYMFSDNRFRVLEWGAGVLRVPLTMGTTHILLTMCTHILSTVELTRLLL